MRQGVLDVGSNTAHLLVVDAHRGAPPLPAFSFKRPIRLAEHLDADGAIDDAGTKALVDFIHVALTVAEDKGCESILGFATSAIREATNGEDVLALVESETGVQLDVLPGSDEARLTFLAVRRWYGWSSGRTMVFDIGGGSLEIAAGSDERPDVAQSLDLGAGRLTREFLSADPPDLEEVRRLRRHVRTEIARDARELLRSGPSDHAVATSKTFRSLARVCGQAPSSEGPYVRRLIERETLAEQLPTLLTLTADQRAGLDGVSAARSHQLVAGAIVAEAILDIFDLDSMEICPWALREGIILEHLDLM
jgi:exopolyphosphatase / guanosine-5'-triphosphate,3'-diphosphate pyrophosphatase